MKEIHLHGSLRARFGGPFSLAVRDPAEAIRALGTQLPGFRDALAEGEWHVVRGSLDDGAELDEQGLALALRDGQQLHLLPAGTGAGRGAGKAIAGVALIGASFLIPGSGLAIGALTVSAGTVASVGVGLALAGVGQMLTPMPGVGAYEQRERPDQRPSFLFDGPVNTSTQGLAVPVVYGEVLTGSVVISAGMTAEEI